MIGKFGTNFLINLYSSASSTSVQSNGGLSSMEQGILNFFNLVLQIIFNEIEIHITCLYFFKNKNLTNDCHQFCSSSCLKQFWKRIWRENAKIKWKLSMYSRTKKNLTRILWNRNKSFVFEMVFFVGNVYIFWEGHKILRNLHLTFVLM